MAELKSENEFLRVINSHFPNTHPHMLQGRGDDCAVIKCPSTMCVSSDLFLEDVHFRRSYFGAGDIGHKGLAVNLSDIASAGAKPLGFSVGLMVVTGRDETYWAELCKGMAELAETFDAALTGGDLSKAGMMGLSVTVWGGPVEDGVPYLERGVCSAGDAIFTVGPVGLARAGLFTLEAKGSKATTIYPDAVQAHLRPMPKVMEGQAIARLNAKVTKAGGAPIGLMDMSDGLARDLPRLLGTETGSGLGAALTVTDAHIHADTMKYAQDNGLDPVEEFVLGGEDYALLGTCPAEHVEALIKSLPEVQIIGTVTEGDTETTALHMTVNGKKWSSTGFDHFSG